MGSDNEMGCSKVIGVLAGIATIIGVVIAILNWIMPFNPIGSSPLASSSNQQLVNTETPPTDTPPSTSIPMQASTGIYIVNNRLLIDEYFIVTLDNIEVLADKKIRVNVLWRNNSSEIAWIECLQDNDDAKAFLELLDGTHIFPLETYCTNNRGERLYLNPGDTTTYWALFPPLKDASQPFNVIWYQWGKVDGVVLR